jgi:hypothetical protein
MLTAKRATFWIMREGLASNHPSAIHAIDAATNIPKPTTIVLGDQLEATKQAATTVRNAASVRRTDSESIKSSQIL